ncbi:MAG: hypothetical protein ACI9CE_002489 [Flavobacterium sp.]
MECKHVTTSGNDGGAMSIGVWQASGPVTVSIEKLKALVTMAKAADLSDLQSTLPKEVITSDSNLMKKQEKDWLALDELDDEELVLLSRFFTLAEAQLNDWAGDKLSPVIYIVKVLKKRKLFDVELRKWIKANTENRYLPNGAVL